MKKTRYAHAYYKMSRILLLLNEFLYQPEVWWPRAAIGILLYFQLLFLLYVVIPFCLFYFILFILFHLLLLFHFNSFSRRF